MVELSATACLPVIATVLPETTTYLPLLFDKERVIAFLTLPLKQQLRRFAKQLVYDYETNRHLINSLCI